MPSYFKDHVILLRYPFSDLSNVKVRPAVVVSAVHPSEDILITPLTSRMGSLLAGEFVGPRQTLKDRQGTVPDQKGKPTNRPTLRWILQCFQSVHLVWLGGVKSQIKLKSRQLEILPFLGNSIQKYYLLSWATRRMSVQEIGATISGTALVGADCSTQK